MSKEKSVSSKKNYIYSLSYQILLMIVPLITTPYIARVLGVDGAGIYSYTTSNVTYFTMLGILGLNTYGQLEVAKVKDNEAKISQLFYELLTTRLCTNLCSLLFYLVLIVCSSKYRYMYILQGILIFANAFDLTWFFQGVEEFKKVSIRNIVIKLISVLFIFLFVKDRNDLFAYTIICNGSTLIGNICLWPAIKQYVEKVDLKPLELKKHFKGAFLFFVPSIASVIMSSLDKTMIGVITKSEEENGYYAQAYKIETLCFTVFSSLNMVMRSRMAYLFNSEKMEEMDLALKKSLQFVLVLVYPMSLGLMAVASDFVPWFFGPGYEKVIILLRIFSLWLIFKTISNCILEQNIMASGKQKVFNAIAWGGAISNFVLNIFMISLYQSVGAAIASVFAEVVICILTLWYSRKKISIKWLGKSSVKYMLVSVIMFVLINGIGLKCTSNIVTTAIQCLVGILFYFIVLLLAKDAYVYGFVKKTLERVKRR